VDDYISSQPEAAQRILKPVRSSIGKALPGAEEVISYKMPTYKLHGTAVLYFAGWRQHYSLYPGSNGVLAMFKDDLAATMLPRARFAFRSLSPTPSSSSPGLRSFAQRKSPNGRRSTKVATTMQAKRLFHSSRCTGASMLFWQGILQPELLLGGCWDVRQKIFVSNRAR
jgi:hypothetical protein